MVLFIDALVVFFAGINGYFGLRRGFIEELGRLLGLFFSTIITLNFYLNLAITLSELLPLDPRVLFIISFAIIFILSIQGFRFITKIFQFLFISSSTKWVNQFLGLVFGFVKGLIFIAAFLWCTELLPNYKISKIILNESRISSKLIKIRYSLVKTFNLEDSIKNGEFKLRKLLKESEISIG